MFEHLLNFSGKSLTGIGVLAISATEKPFLPSRKPATASSIL
jgi:hypothetical protein